MRTKPRTARPVARLVEGHTGWYQIKNAAPDSDTATVLIYDEIGYFGVSAGDFMRDMLAIDAPKVALHINSPGGDVFDGIAIYNAIRNHPAEVTCHIDGLAASAASFIACAGNKVLIADNAQVMIHEAWGLCVGPSEEMTAMAQMLARSSAIIAGIYATKAGGDVAQWRERMLTETWYTAAEAVQAGLADAIEGAGPDRFEQTIAATWDLSIFNYAGRQYAPAPQVHNTLPESAPAPVVVEAEPPDGIAASEPAPAAQVPPVDEVAPAPPEEPPEAVSAPTTEDLSGSSSDAWAELTSSLLAPVCAPPTADEAFAALMKGLS